MAIAAPGVPFAGLVIETVSSTVGMVLAVTGLAAGALRTLALLRGSSQDQVDWMTGVGFCIGVMFSSLVVLLDVAVG